MWFDILEYVHTWYKHKDYILMEYVGLKDKAGKEIYEGDIAIERKGQHPSVVTFTEGSFQLEHNHYDLSGKLTGVYRQPIGFLVNPVEVIGNIYENPELMESQREKQAA